MPTANFTKTYSDGNPLFEADLDVLRNSIEQFVNVTKLNSVNIQDSSLGAIKFHDQGIFAPAGTSVEYSGTAAPSGWLLEDGTSVLAATYPNLFVAIGYTYGGAGANFNLPDSRGRIQLGRDTMGGAGAANRVTLAVSGFDASVLGTLGGNENLPTHLHNGHELTGAAGVSSEHTHTHSASHVHNATINAAQTAATPSAQNQVKDDFGTLGGGAPSLNATTNIGYADAGNTTGVTVTAGSGQHSHPLSGTFDINSNSSGISNGVVQPTIILTKIIKY